MLRRIVFIAGLLLLAMILTGQADARNPAHAPRAVLVTSVMCPNRPAGSIQMLAADATGA